MSSSPTTTVSAVAAAPTNTAVSKPAFDLHAALNRALGGGLSGAAAMVVQVATLMPLRTAMNYQYRFGTTTTIAIQTLYKDGGILRFYRGVSAALIQGPLSRFGDTAANAFALSLLDGNPTTASLPVAVKTIGASASAASFRMFLTPVDTLKTTLQTQGSAGMALLKKRIAAHGVSSLWYGATASAAATFVGHYPWFYTYNTLQEILPQQNTTAKKLGRQAVIGFSASIVSDTISNSLRVIKTYRQVNETRISYAGAARAVIEKDGVVGLFGRGLKTRIITNGLQGIMFSVLWKLFQDMYVI
ncbi:mitochondrial carrier [Fimicolochytrium jonesii]|uniref:mitochondrial carrier n=1 Tax=Fimicolochytrium jonesii TaxID=1396493 RepID=UPI0022FF41E6|nr:mitochondrial carrier [Fimicolochytrium jonesii]KAI8822117.1 mitochondrial carrier [Fimicolochytrium jonesii]